MDCVYDHLTRLIARTQGGATTDCLNDGWNRTAEYFGTTLTKVVSGVCSAF